MELLSVEGLVKHFPVSNSFFRRETKKVYAVNGVSFSVNAGETFGIVGESGSGKSTMGRTILRLIEPTEGKIFFDGKDFCALKGKALRSTRREMQMIFQDPYASLDPRFTVGAIVEEPMKYQSDKSSSQRKEIVCNLLQEVGLDGAFYGRFPFQLSGGQRQRVGIARALALDPRLVIADEPVSALDISVQAQVLNLFRSLQEKRGLTYLFISHDLSVVKHLSDRIAVMYMGEIVEMADCNELFENPLHPYTKALFSAIPTIDITQTRERVFLKGDIPSPIDPPKGCKFHTRCAYCMDCCRQVMPKAMEQNGHMVACHLYQQ